jgi:NAD(P)H dehydrogenase (quinone)
LDGGGTLILVGSGKTFYKQYKLSTPVQGVQIKLLSGRVSLALYHRRSGMRILILYYSRGGNTLKLARAIAEGAAGAGCEPALKSTAEVIPEDFVGAAGIIAGSPVYFGVMAAELKKVFDDFVGVRRKMENKVGAAFATGGHPSGGKETTMFSIIQCMMIYGMIIVGDPMEASGHYGVACDKEPNEIVLNDGRKLGARVARLCRKLGTGVEDGA